MSTPEWDEDAPLVGELRFPKGELILVYPGIGQTNPLGLKSIISESIVLEFELDKEPEFKIGIKKIQINMEIITIKEIALFNIFCIKSSPLLYCYSSIWNFLLAPRSLY